MPPPPPPKRADDTQLSVISVRTNGDDLVDAVPQRAELTPEAPGVTARSPKPKPKPRPRSTFSSPSAGTHEGEADGGSPSGAPVPRPRAATHDPSPKKAPKTPPKTPPRKRAVATPSTLPPGSPAAATPVATAKTPPPTRKKPVATPPVAAPATAPAEPSSDPVVESKIETVTPQKCASVAVTPPQQHPAEVTQAERPAGPSTDGTATPVAAAEPEKEPSEAESGTPVTVMSTQEDEPTALVGAPGGGSPGAAKGMGPRRESLSVVTRQDEVSGKALLVRKAVTSSYGVAKEHQRPRTKVKRKGYLEAKKEREEAEAQLEAQREAAEEAARLEEEERERELAREAEAGESKSGEVVDVYASDDENEATAEPNAEGAHSTPTITEDTQPTEPDTAEQDTTGDAAEEPGPSRKVRATGEPEVEEDLPEGPEDDHPDGPEGASSSSSITAPAEGWVLGATPGKDMAAELGLSEADLAVYEQLWDEATAHANGEPHVTAAVAIRMFEPSKLKKKVLRKVWTMSDQSDPRGELCREEFFLACKLIALAQAGVPLRAENLSAQVPLPTIGSRADAEAEYVSERRPWLTKIASTAQCEAAVRESGDGAFMVQKTSASELTLFANAGGEVVRAPLLYGVRGGKKCYMINGNAFDNLNDLVDAVTAHPETVRWDGHDKGFVAPLTKPAEFSEAVKAMASGGEAPFAPLPAATEIAGTDAAFEEVLTEEEKRRRHIEEQTRLAVAKINKAQEEHLERVRDWMNHKLTLEWEERRAGKKKAPKYDKKVLRKALEAVEANETVYCKAVACVDIKPKAKFFIQAQSGDALEVMQCFDMATPSGLWIVRDSSSKLGFVHTDDIMLNADDVKTHHHGSISSAGSPAPVGETSEAEAEKQRKLSRQVSVYFPDEEDRTPKKSIADHLYDSTESESEE